MSFFKKLVSGVGRFGKKIATSGIGKTVLSGAAAIFGGPGAATAVNLAISKLGEKKTGEMAAMVVKDGTVKVDKVVGTLKKMGAYATNEEVNDMVYGLKSAASGIGSKSITVTQGNTSTSENGESVVGEFSLIEKVKSLFYRAKYWLTANWKKVLLYGVLPLAIIVGVWYLYGKKAKYRR